MIVGRAVFGVALTHLTFVFSAWDFLLCFFVSRCFVWTSSSFTYVWKYDIIFSYLHIYHCHSSKLYVFEEIVQLKLASVCFKLMVVVWFRWSYWVRFMIFTFISLWEVYMHLFTLVFYKLQALFFAHISLGICNFIYKCSFIYLKNIIILFTRFIIY